MSQLFVALLGCALTCGPLLGTKLPLTLNVMISRPMTIKPFKTIIFKAQANNKINMKLITSFRSIILYKYVDFLKIVYYQ